MRQPGLPGARRGEVEHRDQGAEVEQGGQHEADVGPHPDPAVDAKDLEVEDEEGILDEEEPEGRDDADHVGRHEEVGAGGVGVPDVPLVPPLLGAGDLPHETGVVEAAAEEAQEDGQVIPGEFPRDVDLHIHAIEDEGRRQDEQDGRHDQWASEVRGRIDEVGLHPSRWGKRRQVGEKGQFGVTDLELHGRWRHFLWARHRALLAPSSRVGDSPHRQHVSLGWRVKDW